jgi:hypothetical protein
MLQAVFPYVIGLSATQRAFVAQNIDTSDKVVVDLDSDSIVAQEALLLPRTLQTYLTDSLHDLPQQVQKKELEALLNLKRIMLNFVCGLTNNFLPFFLYSACDEAQIIAKEVFAFDDYLKMFCQDDRAFMQHFASNTMVSCITIAVIIFIGN